MKSTVKLYGYNSYSNWQIFDHFKNDFNQFLTTMVNIFCFNINITMCNHLNILDILFDINAL